MAKKKDADSKQDSTTPSRRDSTESVITPEDQDKTREIMEAQARLPEVEGFLKKKSPRGMHVRVC